MATLDETNVFLPQAFGHDGTHDYGGNLRAKSLILNKEAVMRSPEVRFLRGGGTNPLQDENPYAGSPYEDMPVRPRMVTHDMRSYIDPITGKQTEGSSTIASYRRRLKEYFDTHEGAEEYYNSLQATKPSNPDKNPLPTAPTRPSFLPSLNQNPFGNSLYNPRGAFMQQPSFFGGGYNPMSSLFGGGFGIASLFGGFSPFMGGGMPFMGGGFNPYGGSLPFMGGGFNPFMGGGFSPFMMPYSPFQMQNPFMGSGMQQTFKEPTPLPKAPDVER